MKTNWLVGSVFLAGAMVLQAQTNDLSAALRQGLFEEEANRNLDAAISNYQALATQFDQDRQIAATAVFRLGECYRQLGQTNDAVAQYQRILREFSDQQTLATLSRQNLTGLGVASQPHFQQRLQAIIAKNPQDSTVSTATESVTKAAELEAEAAALKGQIPHLTSLNREDRRIAIQQNFSNPVLTKLMQDLTDAEQKLAVLTNDYALQDMHVVRAAALVNAINGQIDAQMSGVIEGLQSKMEADLNAAKTLRDQSEPVQAIHADASTVTASEDQEIRRIQQLIQNSPDLINARSAGDFTLLGDAARNGLSKRVTFLLDHGAGINVGQGNGETALHSAVKFGNRAMVELLLSRGADVNATADDGQTPLCFAVDKGFQAITEVLLANKAEVNVSDKNMGNTPLHLAAKGGHVKIIPMLLAAGANPNVENKRGRTPLSFAAQSGPLESVKLLLDAKADPNGGKLDPPLLCAIQKQDLASAELLLKRGANPNVKGDTDWQATIGFNTHTSYTPLYLAVSTEQLPLVNLLLKFKADPNDSQTDGRPLLFSALSNPDILGALLAAVGQVESHLSEGKTLLGQAVNGNSPKAVVEILLKHGADPNARDLRGNTPLHFAVWCWGSADWKTNIELLLGHQADPNVRDGDGKTPLDYVKERLGQSNIASDQKKPLNDVAGLLRSHGALDNLPHWDRITVSRPLANFSQTVFERGTNDWNRFSLFEALATVYRLTANAGDWWPGTSASVDIWSFPDLAHVKIRRATPDGKSWKEIPVDLEAISGTSDCGHDVPLEWGDVLEIPEKDHLVTDRPLTLPQPIRELLARCLKRTVTVRVHGESKAVEMAPDATGSGMPQQFSVRWALEGSGLLRASSDTTRVKIIRPNARTGKTSEWVANCSNPSNFHPAYGDPNPKLWLRDGDVIEVPEK
jgi:ankyrin repeat protein